MHLCHLLRRFHKTGPRRLHHLHDLDHQRAHVPLPLRQVYPILYSIHLRLRLVSCIVYPVTRNRQLGNRQPMDNIIQLRSHFNSSCIRLLHHRQSSVGTVYIASCILVYLNLAEPADWTSPTLSSVSASASATQPSIRIQAPRPMAPPSSASAVLQYRQPTASGSSTPSEDSRGKKRAFDGDAELESSRPRKRNYAWPLQDCIYSTQVKSDEDAGVQQITFSSDGERFAVICKFVVDDAGRKCLSRWRFGLT